MCPQQAKNISIILHVRTYEEPVMFPVVLALLNFDSVRVEVSRLAS